jgi:hypothetical protein
LFSVRFAVAMVNDGRVGNAPSPLLLAILSMWFDSLLIEVTIVAISPC